MTSSTLRSGVGLLRCSRCQGKHISCPSIPALQSGSKLGVRSMSSGAGGIGARVEGNRVGGGLGSLRISSSISPFHNLSNQLHQHRHKSTTSNTNTPSSPLTKSCPTCSSPIPLSASPCPKCKSLCPIPSTLSHYALFSLSDGSNLSKERKHIMEELRKLPGGGFDLDLKGLRNVYLRRQQGVHPDSFVGKGEKEHSLALAQSGMLNKAYSTLVDPLSRAQYLLQLHDLPISETDSLTDPELLMVIMEAREALEDAKTEEDMEKVRGENGERTKETLELLSKAFGSSPPDIARAKELTVELQYLRNLEEAAKNWRPGGRVEIMH